MKNLYKNILAIMTLALFSVFLIASCTVEKKAAPPAKTELKNEILVASDIGRGSDVWPVFWCGNNAILAYSEEMGIEVIKIPSGERIKVSSKKDDYPFNCSPDGKWVVYVDRDSTRLHKSEKVMTAEDYGLDPGLDVWPVWEGYVADLYRFNVETGEKHRFAVVRSELPSWEIISPDGTKAFLGGVHNSSIDMPKPKWTLLWLSPTKNPKNWSWGQTDARWFKDSSGVVILGGDTLDIEVFENKSRSEKGWAKRFAIDPKPIDGIYSLSVDRNNNIYFIATEKASPDSGNYLLYRCKIKNKQLSCEIIHTFKEFIYKYTLLTDGDILYRNSDNHCISRITPNLSDEKCVVDLLPKNSLYVNLSLIGLSPDGKQLAFKKIKNLGRKNRISYIYEDDLFIIELTN